MERETGFEPATACLEGRNSTTELLPHEHVHFSPKAKPRQKVVIALSNLIHLVRGEGYYQGL